MKKSRTAVIVGGTGNVGKGCVRRFADAGFSVLALSRHAPQGYSDSARWRECDVTVDTVFRAALSQIREDSGGIDVMVYTPALPPDVEVPLASYSMDAWRKTWDVYVSGFLVAFQESLRLMESGGHIVALGSAVTRFDGTHLPPLFAGHYAAAKAALNELCKWGRREAHERGLLLSRIAPGALDVPYHRQAPPERRPKAMLPVSEVVGKIVAAVDEGRELDLEIVASA